jgi:hypothetical protein
MHQSTSTLALAACSALLLAGCSSNSGGFFNSLTTQSIPASTTGTTVAAVPKIDPACYSLAQRIDTLRKDGLTERLEKAGTGKTANVSVKRASLQQAAELDRANAEFQAKCSTLGPRPMQASAQVTPAGTATPPASQAKTTAAVAPAVAPPVVVPRQ